MKFSNLNRHEIVRKVKSEAFDLLVIGGGITGAGIALDATTRGISTALLEMQDFGAGTSSRSTKLVHGGLRYLKQFEIKMVADVGKERAIVYENGPHVTTPEWMLLPFHKGGTFGKYSTSIGLRIYDHLAGVKRSERRKMLTAKDTLAKEPLIKQENLKGGGYYVEYRTDDARLTLEVMKEAVDNGATALNYSKVKKLIYKNGNVSGVLVEDLLTGKEFEVFAKKVVNATGPWVDGIRELDNSKSGKTLKLSKGVHIVLDKSAFPLKQAIYFDTPDGRMIFAIPRGNKAYVGTTDTFYSGDVVTPTITEGDRNYILNAIHYMFPEVKVTEKDIESSWAGIRPLIHEDGKAPSQISRKDEFWESDTGLITIAGGKLTGYRKMAETIVNLISEKLTTETKNNFKTCKTKHLPISGGNVGGSENFNNYVDLQVRFGTKVGLSDTEARELAFFYGSNVANVFELVDMQKALAFNIPLPLFAQLEYAIQHEMATTPLDFFNRRTGALLFNIQLVYKHAESVIEYMQTQLDWDDNQKKTYTKELWQAVNVATSVD